MKYVYVLLILSFPAYAAPLQLDARFVDGREAHGTIQVESTMWPTDWDIAVGDFHYTPENSFQSLGMRAAEMPSFGFQSEQRALIVTTFRQIIGATSGSFQLTTEPVGSDFWSVEKFLAPNGEIIGVSEIVSGCLAVDSTPCHLVPEPQTWLLLALGLAAIYPHKRRNAVG